MVETRTLPALALAIAERFPELNNRCIAVSEVNPFNNKTNMPTLPIAIVALVHELGAQQKAGGGNINLSDDIVVTFILEPVKYTVADGSDSPFFAYYDYETLRDTMLSLTKNWRSPRGAGFSYRGMDVQSTEFAVYITMRFNHEEKWCDPSPLPTKEAIADGGPYDVILAHRVLQPRGECCEPCLDCVEPDPCLPARERNPYGKEAMTAEELANLGPITS